MDTQSYYADVKAKIAELEAQFPDRVVHITSLEHREKNTTPGTTFSATPRVAALRIVNQTHRLATEAEIAAFHELQKKNFRTAAQAEMVKKQQFMSVIPGGVALSQALGQQFEDVEAAGAGAKKAR